jgi:5'-nucleotidase
MKFLLTNDDGFDAAGLQVLQRVASEWGETLTVAPQQCFSGCGHQTTTNRPLQLIEVRPGQFRLDGTPADCTRVGIEYLSSRQSVPMAAPIDWVLAGVNHGGNLGSDVYCSGTVAAIREAALLGLPGVAISQYRRHPGDVNWQRAAAWTQRVLGTVLQQPLPPRSYWNVNLPDPEPDANSAEHGQPEIVFCAVDGSPLPVKFRHEHDLLHYSGSYHDRPRTPGSDVDHCFNGRITVSCITLL